VRFFPRPQADRAFTGAFFHRVQIALPLGNSHGNFVRTVRHQPRPDAGTRNRINAVKSWSQSSVKATTLLAQRRLPGRSQNLATRLALTRIPATNPKACSQG
jgi:hypothetical protein